MAALCPHTLSGSLSCQGRPLPLAGWVLNKCFGNQLQGMLATDSQEPGIPDHEKSLLTSSELADGRALHPHQLQDFLPTPFLKKELCDK